MSKKLTVVAPWEITADMFLSESETDALLQFVRLREATLLGDARIRASVDRLIVELLIFSGLRNSELCRLRIVDTVIGHGQSAVQVSGTPKQDRLVFIPQSLSKSIERFVKETRVHSATEKVATEKVATSDKQQPLILNERGRPYDRTALYRRVVRILTEAGIKARASVQLLRHTYGFLAYKRTGGNLLFVQRQLGHAHPMVTAVYAQFAEFSNECLADLVSAENQMPIRPSADRAISKPRRKKGAKQ